MLIATCHCGDTRIEVPALPVSATRCTCSFCSKSGALWAYFAPGDLKIAAPHDAVYSASGGINRHHFCARCGCQTFGVSPDWTMESLTSDRIPEKERFALNIRLLDDIDVSAIEVTTIDGRNLW